MPYKQDLINCINLHQKTKEVFDSSSDMVHLRMLQSMLESMSMHYWTKRHFQMLGLFAGKTKCPPIISNALKMEHLRLMVKLAMKYSQVFICISSKYHIISYSYDSYSFCEIKITYLRKLMKVTELYWNRLQAGEPWNL